MEGYCKAGGFTSRSFRTEAVLGKSCRVLVIYLTKFRKENPWIFPYLVLCINFRVWIKLISQTFKAFISFNNGLAWSSLFTWKVIRAVIHTLIPFLVKTPRGITERPNLYNSILGHKYKKKQSINKKALKKSFVWVTYTTSKKIIINRNNCKNRNFFTDDFFFHSF